MQRLNRVRWLSLVAGILLIALSIINMLNPVEFTVSLVTFFAASLIVLGVIRIIRYFSWTVFSTGSFLIGGILDVLLGVLMLKNKLASVQVLLILVGFWVLTNAICEANDLPLDDWCNNGDNVTWRFWIINILYCSFNLSIYTNVWNSIYINILWNYKIYEIYKILKFEGRLNSSLFF